MLFLYISKFKIDISPAPFSGSTGDSNDGRGAAPEVSKALPRYGGQQQAQPPGKRGRGSGEWKMLAFVVQTSKA